MARARGLRRLIGRSRPAVALSKTDEQAHGLEVVVDPGAMAAWLRVPKRCARDVTIEDALAALEAAGVVYGVDEVALAGVPFDAPGSHLVARGRPPVDGTDGRVIVVVSGETADSATAGQTDEGDPIDLRAFSALRVVHAGQVVAVVVPPTAGTKGCDVLGGPVAPLPGRPPRLALGQYVERSRSGTVIRAAIDGLLVVDGDAIAVRPAFVVEGDVDFDTGSIAFPGDVVVRGSVMPGFRVRAQRVLVLGDVDQAEVVAVEEAWIRGAVVGDRSVVRCGGDVTARVLYEGRLEAGRNVFVEREAYEGAIVAGHSVVLDAPRTRIAGGVVVAGREVVASEIGSLAGIPTLVRVGVDPFQPSLSRPDGASARHQAAKADGARVVARLAFRAGCVLDVGGARLALARDEFRRAARWSDGRVVLGPVGGPPRHRPEEVRWGALARRLERGEPAAAAAS